MFDRIQGVPRVLFAKLIASAKDRSNTFNFNPSWISVKDTPYEANKILCHLYKPKEKTAH